MKPKWHRLTKEIINNDKIYTCTFHRGKKVGTWPSKYVTNWVTFQKNEERKIEEKP